MRNKRNNKEKEIPIKIIKPEQASIVSAAEKEQREIISDKQEEIDQKQISPEQAKRVVSEKLSQGRTLSASSAKTEQQKKIENILEEGLGDVYFSLPQEKRVEFKAGGEEAANKINVILEGTKVKIKRIIDIIRKWLRLIPGVNKFFIEQEAKLKADKIVKLKGKNINK